MKISCFIFGEQALAIQCGDLLLNANHEVRGIVAENPDIGTWAQTRGVRLVDPASDVGAVLKERPFDYLFSIANMKLLPKEIVALPRRGTINFHDGPLPRYSGVHATSWAILNGEARHGITWHFIGDRVDGGSILKQREIEIAPDETAFSLNAKCFEAGIESFAELMNVLRSGTVRACEQDLSQRTYFGMFRRPPAACVVSWQKNAAEISALVRATEFGPYPNAMGRAKIQIGGEFFLCPKVEVLSGRGHAQPGSIMALEADRIIVSTPDRPVAISQFLTLEGQPARLDDVVQKFGLQTGTRLPEPEPDLRERVTRADGDLCKHEHFWVQALQLFRPAQVPYFEARSLGDGGKTPDTIEMAVPEAVEQFLRTNHPDWNASEFLVFAFAAYLARLCGEDELSLGLKYPELALEVAGLESLFASRVPLNLRVNAAEGFAGQFGRWREDLSQARAHKTFARDLISRYPTLRALTDKQPNSLWPVWVELATTLEGYVPDPGPSLGLVVAHEGQRCRWIFDPQTLCPANARQMAGQFTAFLLGLVANAEQPLARLALMSEKESRRLLVEWNDTPAAVPEDICVHHAFEQQVQRTPAKVAVVCGDEQLTYDELNGRANQLARHLVKLGVGPEVIVGVSLERRTDLFVALLGILKAGGAYLPLDPSYPRERIAFILEDAKVRVLITRQHLLQPDLSPHAVRLAIDADWPQIGQESVANLDVQVTPRNLAYVIYTSGSTGKPKGVMIEHGNVINFFSGMDARIGESEPGVWLAVTSISFDISVLELFWTLARGFTVVLYRGEIPAVPVAKDGARAPGRTIDFSLFYFASDQGEYPQDRYRLLVEGAKFADAHAFAAVWTPERHFHAFGGLYPNPSVTSAALAMVTQRVKLRAGSVVLPLHSPIRVAEEWALVDNLSKGRIGISIASGWQANDFALKPENYSLRKEVMFRDLDIVRRLWRGEAVLFRGGDNKEIPISILPRPVQPELPVWVTAAGNPETFRMAGEVGANVLTHLLGQRLEEVAEKIQIYRRARLQAGYESEGHVTLMLHTYVGRDRQTVREKVHGPLCNYLRSSVDLIKNAPQAFPAFKLPNPAVAEKVEQGMKGLSAEDLEQLLEFAFDRYFDASGLFGTVEQCLELVDRVKEIGADEIGCLIDFGVDFDSAMASLELLDEVRRRSLQASGGTDYSIPALIRKHRVTHLQCTPSLARALMATSESREALRTIQKLMLGGEALPPPLIAELKKIVTGEIHNMYGPTETTVWSATSRIDGDGADVHLGRPIANTDFYVLDRHLQPVPAGVPGELFIGGKGVARGYLNRLELTAERFIENPFPGTRSPRLYRTGDLVRYRGDGNVDFLGRVDFQVKIRGHRVELGEIETALAQHQTVREAVVVSHEDSSWGERRLVAYVVLKGSGSDNGGPSNKDLQKHLRQTLPDYMIPAAFVFLGRLPLTPNGKVDRRSLPAPSSERPTLEGDFVPPRNDVEEKLCRIWESVLGIRQVGVKDDFFSLGGDSLSIIQVAVQAEKVFGLRLSIVAVVQARTVERLAVYLSASQPREAAGWTTQAPSSGQTSTVAVRKMCEADLEAVIDIHIDRFPEWRVTMLGRPFLREMYRWFMENQGGLTLVALDEGKLIGFTAGSVGGFKRHVFLRGLPQIVRGAALNPLPLLKHSARRILKRVGVMSGGETVPPAVVRPDVADNNIMALSRPTDRGGVELMLAFEEAARQKGVQAHFHESAQRPS